MTPKIARLVSGTVAPSPLNMARSRDAATNELAVDVAAAESLPLVALGPDSSDRVVPPDTAYQKAWRRTRHRLGDLYDYHAGNESALRLVRALHDSVTAQDLAAEMMFRTTPGAPQ